MQKIKLFLFLVLALFLVEVVSLSDNSLLTTGSSGNVLVNVTYIDKLNVPLVYSKSDQINLSQFNFSVNKNYMGLYNRTLIYVTLVNRSSYIVFYPNLYKSYLDLSDSLKVKNSDPALSYELLKEAYINANLQLKNINGDRDIYRILALVAMIVLTVLTTIYLIRIMKGLKSKATLSAGRYDTIEAKGITEPEPVKPKAKLKSKPKAKPKAKKSNVKSTKRSVKVKKSNVKAKKSKAKKSKKANK